MEQLWGLSSVESLPRLAEAANRAELARRTAAASRDLATVPLASGGLVAHRSGDAVVIGGDVGGDTADRRRRLISLQKQRPLLPPSTPTDSLRALVRSVAMSFLKGWAVDGTLSFLFSLFGRPKLLVTQPWKFLRRTYLSGDTARFGAFFAAVTALYRLSKLAVSILRKLLSNASAKSTTSRNGSTVAASAADGSNDAADVALEGRPAQVPAVVAPSPTEFLIEEALCGCVAGLGLLALAPEKRVTMALYMVVRAASDYITSVMVRGGIQAPGYSNVFMFALCQVSIVYGGYS